MSHVSLWQPSLYSWTVYFPPQWQLPMFLQKHDDYCCESDKSNSFANQRSTALLWGMPPSSLFLLSPSSSPFLLPHCLVTVTSPPIPLVPLCPRFFWIGCSPYTYQQMFFTCWSPLWRHVVMAANHEIPLSCISLSLLYQSFEKRAVLSAALKVSFRLVAMTS